MKNNFRVPSSFEFLFYAFWEGPPDKLAEAPITCGLKSGFRGQIISIA
jgi:hypothetical protein